jgi:HD-GYP domain-containing protein (c-di-GMP phosphodiesterase class II)
MIPGLKNPADIIRFIGENFDGSGYPHKLAGDQIPLLARILRVADEYDCIARPREEGAALDRAKAIELLRRRSSIEFDPRVVATLELVLANDKVPTLIN